MPSTNNVLILLFLFFLPIENFAQKTTVPKSFKKIIAKVKAAENALLNKKPKEAENIYLEILKKKPDYLVALRGLSIAYQLQNKFEASAASLERVIEKNPKFSRIVYAEVAMA